MSSSSDSRSSKGARSRSSSKKSNNISNNVPATSSELAAINACYATKKEVGLQGVPLYSALSVSNQYSLLTKGGCLTEYSKETWSTQINVSQSGAEKLPANLTAQRFSSKEFSASLVTSKSSVKTFQITPECTASNVLFASAVGRSNTTFAIQTTAPELSSTSTWNKKNQPQTMISQTQSRPEMKAIMENSSVNPSVKFALSTNKSPTPVPKSVTEKTIKTTSSKNVNSIPKAKNSQPSCQKTSTFSSSSHKSVPITSSKSTGVNNKDQKRSSTTLRKVGEKQLEIKSAPPKTKLVGPPAKHTAQTGQPKILSERLKWNKLKPVVSSNKSSLPSNKVKSKSKIASTRRITRNGIRRRNVVYPKFSLVSSYKVSGKEPLIVKKGNSLAVNEKLQTHKRPKLIYRKTLIPKVILKAVHCGPVTPEAEDETSFILPKYSLPCYDFKNNIIKKNKNEFPSESPTAELETEHICEETYEYTNDFNKFAREEERREKRRALYSNIGIRNVTNTQPTATNSQIGLSGVQIVSESLVNTVPNDSVMVLCSNNLAEVPATNAFLTFHSTINSCSSSSTATTNVTQITTTPIVSSFVKERVVSTPGELQNATSLTTVVQSSEAEPSSSQENTKESSSNSSTKTKESSSKNKSKSKSKESSKSKSKESSSKSKSKETSSPHKSKSNDNPLSSKDIVADLPSTETLDMTTSMSTNSHASKVSSQQTPTLPSEITTNSQSNVASTSNNAEASSASTSTATSTAASAVTPEDDNYDFGDDIRNIMHAFGDSADPNPESVKMMEVIVREELNGFVYLCELAALATKASTLHFREAIFTLRREKQRVGRLFRYFKHKDKHKPPKQASNQAVKEPVGTYESELMEIAEEMDETGEYARLFEFGAETTLNNCELRADRIVQRLTMPKFLMYSKARSVSFARKMPRLAEWVIENIHSRIPLSLAFVDILGFLTYEIVAELMNMAVLVRSERVAITPFERIVDMRGLNPDTCMSDPSFLKKRCFGLQSVSEILVQAGELQAMRLQKLKTRSMSFNEEYHKQILPIDVREGYLRFANEQLLEPSLSYKCQAAKLSNRPQRWPRKTELSTKTAKPAKLAI